MKYIQLHTKDDFKAVMKKYNNDARLYMWDQFKSETCYVPERGYFISLEKAEKIKNSELITI